MGRYVHVLRNNSGTDKVRRGQRTIKDVFDVLPVNEKVSPSHLNDTTVPACIDWRVACITARADVYTMMMGSLTDDQMRHSPDDVVEANVQSVRRINKC